MSRGLRYTSTATMPETMRQAAERAMRKADTPQPIEKGDVRRKYNNSPTTVDGIRFDSKREARFYERLCLERKAGQVLFFLRQVPVHLPGGTRLVLDFVVFMADGSTRFIDVKGRETAAFKIKRREIQHHYPLTVELA